MRTTLTIDDDLFNVAKVLADEKDTSIGKVISYLAKKGLTHPSSSVSKSKKDNFPVFSVSEDAPPITLNDVKKLEDEI